MKLFCRVNEEEIKDIVRLEKLKIERNLTVEEEIQLYEAFAKKKRELQTQTNGGCADGQHCQRVVAESELDGLLVQGWRVAAVLPSGKIVVSNE
jgi:isocitrate lyase